jgi:hypothetical protein
MKLTKKIQERLDVPVHTIKPDIQYQHNFVHNLPNLKTKIDIHFDVDSSSELVLQNASFELLDQVVYRGAIDLYFSLIDGRAIESLDRVTNKEFDYYLRDDLKIGVFEFYDNKFYEVLGIGEAILNFLKPKNEGPTPLMVSNLEDRFFTISFSEQIEYFEELLARYVYGHIRYSELEIEIDDVVEQRVLVNISAREKGLEELLIKACMMELGVKSIGFNYLS